MIRNCSNCKYETRAIRQDGAIMIAPTQVFICDNHFEEYKENWRGRLKCLNPYITDYEVEEKINWRMNFWTKTIGGYKLNA